MTTWIISHQTAFSWFWYGFAAAQVLNLFFALIKGSRR